MLYGLMICVTWHDEQVVGAEAAELRQHLGMLPTSEPLSLQQVISQLPLLDVCRVPDQRVVLSAGLGVRSQRSDQGDLTWEFFKPADDLPRGLVAGLCGRSAHDLRAILTALTGWVDLAQLDGRDDLGWVESLLAQMQQIADRLATAGQLQAGGLRLDIQQLSGPEFEQLLRARLATVATPLQVQVAPGVYRLDANLLMWASTILVTGARYRDRNGAIQVAVWQDTAGQYLSVTDHGMGLEDDEIAAINVGATWQLAANLQRSAGVGLSLLTAALLNTGGSLQVSAAVDPTCLLVTVPPAVTAAEPV